MTYYTVTKSPLGDVVLVARSVAAGEVGLAGVCFTDQRYAFAIGADWIEDPGALADAERQLEAYFAGDSTSFDLRYALGGSEFQRSVWLQLADIPYGSTWTYGELAGKVADRSKTRAIAAAVGRNPLGIVLPCHRVIGADGSLTGYAGGLERKRWLLDHEADVIGRKPMLPV